MTPGPKPQLSTPSGYTNTLHSMAAHSTASAQSGEKPTAAAKAPIASSSDVLLGSMQGTVCFPASGSRKQDAHHLFPHPYEALLSETQEDV